MKKPVVLIQIEGGSLTSVRSDTNIELTVIDWDNINSGDPLPEESKVLLEDERLEEKY